MNFKTITTIDYHYGEEEKIRKLLYESKEPIIIKIANFTDKFSLDYFEERVKEETTYSTFENDQRVAHQAGDFATVIAEIKKNKPHRIFGQFISKKQSAEIEAHVPLWQAIPFRPRYFKKDLGVIYFFGGKGSHTSMHFDWERCCNLHLCLSGKKQMLLFTEDQSDNVYKLPFVGNSLIDFGLPLSTICEKFPRFNRAQGYTVELERGDMLFMPKNCWHYTSYLDAAASATYVFYPNKFLQFYGSLTGTFSFGYQGETGFGMIEWPLLERFGRYYALSAGRTKSVLKVVEKTIFAFMLPAVSLATLISYKLKPRRLF